MTTTRPHDPLLARAEALKLYGLLAHWSDLAERDWVASLIEWEEQERSRRSLERRLGNAHLGRFKPLADFDWLLGPALYCSSPPRIERIRSPVNR